MKALHVVTCILIIVGALNWGLVGLGELFGAGMTWNLVSWLIGSWSPTVEAIVYVLVGISAIVDIVNHKSMCKCCDGNMKQGM